MSSLHGIHHVTAIAGPARRNLDFYTRTLGLRLVKKTVNFDDPGTYHLYYGDEQGQPGTILTFFPWEHAAPGRLGVGETQETAVPRAGGRDRLLGASLRRAGRRRTRRRPSASARPCSPFQDPDGMRLALVAVPGAESEPAWSERRGAGRARDPRLPRREPAAGEAAPTGAILTDVLGFAEVGARRLARPLRRPATRPSAASSICARPAASCPAGMGGGSVHHIAFRAADDAAQAAMVEKLARDHGIRATEQKDRNYFRSVYFREPGGVLFEIATDIRASPSTSRRPRSARR